MTNAIITSTARAAMAGAWAGGTALPAITGMAFGNGGVDSGGNPIPPASSATALNNELLRQVLDSCTASGSVVTAVCTLAPATLAGYQISELGLYDSGGNLVAIKTFTAKGKDSDSSQTYTVTLTF